MKTLNINFKDGKIIPFPVHNESSINDIIINLFTKDTENNIDSISVLPIERECKEYDKERCLQRYY